MEMEMEVNNAVTACLADIDRGKISGNSFISLTSEQIGFCLDLVYDYSAEAGWIDSIYLMQEDKNLSDENWGFMKSCAKKLGEELGVKVMADSR